jgi:hypothetical protein
VKPANAESFGRAEVILDQLHASLVELRRELAKVYDDNEKGADDGSVDAAR